MDKQVIFAVAGSGKTRLIIEALDVNSKILIITYTKNNTTNLRKRIIKRFGVFPDNITLMPYFTFLYSLCFRPILAYPHNVKGIYFDRPPQFTARMGLQTDARYITKNRRIYHNRLAKFIDIKGGTPLVKQRLEQYFDNIYIDEVQDFGGHDFNFLKELASCNINILMVGDFFQHTFDTSNDGRTNGKLYSDYTKYQKHFKGIGIEPDLVTLNKSWRCSPTVCDFITENLGINITSNHTKSSNIIVVESQEKANEYYYNNDIIKLFYKEHHKYGCYSENMGKTKGDDAFQDVCVVLNKTSYTLFQKGKLSESAPTTKNKLYVAFSRANKDLIILPQDLISKYKVS